jgi:hypothetical protein
MRVETAAEVFQTDDHAHDVLALVRHFREKRHDWALNPLVVPAVEDYLDRHVPLLARSYKDLARQAALREGAYTTPRDGRPVRITPEDIANLVHDLGRPAVVMVENDASDGGFIKAVARILRDAGVLAAIDNEWLVIDHAGGAPDLFRRAKDKRDRFRRLSRVAAVLDGDRMLPGDPPDHHEDIEKLRAGDVRVHVLQLREIENYIPDRVLRLVGPQCRPEIKIAALGSLTKEQRGHYDMKVGFKNGNVAPAQEELYENVPRDVIEDLDGGFGRKVIATFLTHAEVVTEEDLRSDVGPDVPAELRAMLAMIREIV